jgi:hypothetical protein
VARYLLCQPAARLKVQINPKRLQEIEPDAFITEEIVAALDQIRRGPALAAVIARHNSHPAPRFCADGLPGTRCRARGNRSRAEKYGAGR